MLGPEVRCSKITRRFSYSSQIALKKKVWSAHKDKRSVTVRQIADVSVFMNHYSRPDLSISPIYISVLSGERLKV